MVVGPNEDKKIIKRRSIPPLGSKTPTITTVFGRRKPPHIPKWIRRHMIPSGGPLFNRPKSTPTPKQRRAIYRPMLAQKAAVEKMRDMAGFVNRVDLHKRKAWNTNKLNSEVRWSDVARIKTDRDHVSPPYKGRTRDREIVPAYNIINPIITGLRNRKTNPQTLPASGSKGRHPGASGGTRTSQSGGGGSHLT